MECKACGSWFSSSKHEDICPACERAMNRLKIKILYDRLRELVDADRDGRCVVLPCKVGDVLYSAFPLCGINTHQVRKFERNSEGDFACSALMIPFSDFGKRVFLNREAAEAALKAQKG